MKAFVPQRRSPGIDSSRPPQERYKILGRIATGGMAEIYLARMATRSGGWREIVLKRLLPDLQSNHEFIQMFFDEARIASEMNHPNIVQIHELGELDGSLFIAMELVRGVNLKEIQDRARREGKAIGIPLALRIASGALDGLAYAHRFVDEHGKPQNVVHRDISPQNILVTYQGEVKLVDFGVAKAEDRLHHTREGMVKGKFAYMAPEQITGEAIDARCDLFALAEVVYELTLMRHPFYAESDAAVLNAVLEARFPSPFAIDPRYPPVLGAILVRALRRNPDDRFPDAPSMQAAIEAFARDRFRPTTSETLGRFVREIFADRLRLEERARNEDDDDLLVEAMRVGAHPRPLPAKDLEVQPERNGSEPSEYSERRGLRATGNRRPRQSARSTESSLGIRGRRGSSAARGSKSQSGRRSSTRKESAGDAKTADHLPQEAPTAPSERDGAPEGDPTIALVAVAAPGAPTEKYEVVSADDIEPLVEGPFDGIPDTQDDATLEAAVYAPGTPRSARTPANLEGEPERSAVRARPPSGADVAGVKIGKYQLLKRLGAGAMAEVFLARQSGPQGFEKRVALKRILPQFSREAAFVEMLLREAKLAARLSHPNIVQVLDLGLESEQYYIAMEYVHGWDLGRVFEQCRRLSIYPPISIACRIVSDICSALSAAHTSLDDSGRLMPILHRDVAPQNVLISAQGGVKLTDFGIAKAVDNASLSRSDDLRGKPGYMAPERLSRESGGTIDARSDIFSAGALLYEALVLTPMFKRSTAFETMMAVLSDPVVPMAAIRAEVPRALEMVVERAAARAQSERYSNAHDFQLDLERFLARLGGEPVTVAYLGAWLRTLFSKKADSEEISTDADLTLRGDRELESRDPGARSPSDAAPSHDPPLERRRLLLDDER